MGSKENFSEFSRNKSPLELWKMIDSHEPCSSFCPRCLLDKIGNKKISKKTFFFLVLKVLYGKKKAREKFKEVFKGNSLYLIEHRLSKGFYKKIIQAIDSWKSGNGKYSIHSEIESSKALVIDSNLFPLLFFIKLSDYLREHGATRVRELKRALRFKLKKRKPKMRLPDKEFEKLLKQAIDSGICKIEIIKVRGQRVRIVQPLALLPVKIEKLKR